MPSVTNVIALTGASASASLVVRTNRPTTQEPLTMYAFPMHQHFAGAGNARVHAGIPCVMASASWSRDKYLTIDTKPEPRRSTTSP
jgi:hypothetical protein